MRIRSIVIASVAIASAASPALARTRHVPPIGRADVQSATLVQNGRSLVWTTTLVHGISPRGVASGARRVCLQLETRRSRDVEETVCLGAAATAHRLGLSATTWHGSRVGGTRPLHGTVTRSDDAHTVTATFSVAALGVPDRPARWQVRSSATNASCPMTAPVDGGNRHHHVCTVTYPARAPVVALHTPILAGCAPAGPSLVYGATAGRREIALTFDDGPWPDPPTIQFVDELQRLGVVGTFFEIGEQISEFDPTGAVERAMLADGDMIGDHTWTHPNMLKLTPAEQTTELMRTNEAIRHATGFTPCLWRPPYGATSPALQTLARGLGMLTIDWDIDSRDWALPGTNAIVTTVLQEAQDGGIALMHFGGGPREQTLQALPQIVAGLRDRGYRFVTVPQLLGLHEIWH